MVMEDSGKHVVTKVKNVRQIPKVLFGIDLSALSAPVRVDWIVLAVAYQWTQCRLALSDSYELACYRMHALCM